MASQEGKSYISDPKLVPRIKLFLKTKDPQVTVLPESVVQHLQATYGDYARKKKSAFFHSVVKALKVAKSEVFGSEAQAKVGKKRRQLSSSDSEPENLVAYENTNSLNLAMRELYKRTNAIKAQSPSTPEQQKKSEIKKLKGTPTSTTPENPNSADYSVGTDASSGPRRNERLEQKMDEELTEVCDASHSSDRPSASHSGDRPSARTFSYLSRCTCGVVISVNMKYDNDASDDASASGRWTMSCPCVCSCGVQRVIRVTDEVKDSEVSPVSSVQEERERMKTVTQRDDTDASHDTEGKVDGKLSSSTKKKRLKKKRTETGDTDMDLQDSDTMAKGDGKSSSSTKRKLKKKRKRNEDSDADLPGVEPTIPQTTLDDFKGSRKLQAELLEDFDEFFYSDCGRMTTQSFRKPCFRYLVHGPQGSGKRFLAECIAGDLKVPLLKPSVNTLISGVSGDSEQRVRDLFEEAANEAPCVLYLEDIDCLAPRQDTPGGSKDMMNRIISELGRCIDELEERPEHMVVIATTCRIESVHTNLRNSGRFIEKAIGMPDEESREALLEKMCSNFLVSPEVSFETLARRTPGFVAGDLRALVKDAYAPAFRRLRDLYRASSTENSDAVCRRPQPPPHLDGADVTLTEQDKAAIALTEEDFMGALKKAQPAAKREGFPIVPSITWADIGALQFVRSELHDSILFAIWCPEMASDYSLPTKSGTILVGPPGCGKTLVAKAMANEAGLNFMHIKGPELLDKYVGESEKKLRDIFEKAQTCAPCLIFFDEMDALCSSRQNSEGSNVGKSVTNQLLTLMDGCGERNRVYVMGATNLVENLDLALVRPGRFDNKIFIGLPDAEGRLDILKALTKGGTKPKLAPCCDLQQIAHETEGFSGADLKRLIEVASMLAAKERMRDVQGRQDERSERMVTGEHFSRALKLVQPSVRKKDAEKYRQVALRM